MLLELAEEDQETVVGVEDAEEDYPVPIPIIYRTQITKIDKPNIHTLRYQLKPFEGFERAQEDTGEPRKPVQYLYYASPLTYTKRNDTPFGPLLLAYETIRDMKEQCFTYPYDVPVHYWNLWLLFKPGEVVFAKVRGQFAGFVVVSAKCRRNCQDGSTNQFDNGVISVWNLAFNGDTLTCQAHTFSIDRYQGEKEISSLGIFPVKYLKDSGTSTEELIERGKSYYKIVCSLPSFMEISLWTLLLILTMLLQSPVSGRPRPCDCSNIKTFQLETFYSDGPEYAAILHTWGDEEVTFQDLTATLGQKNKGWNEILGSTHPSSKAQLYSN
ncbi:hypothetical protein V501_01480 [Pseudogymnoascus sp. VKM F-4519 (FW-2642)]|nr:hypothetical protein V501_01480 [Pseudogymnoascus sp. VKM F-4519 (FW-2642)]